VTVGASTATGTIAAPPHPTPHGPQHAACGADMRCHIRDYIDISIACGGVVSPLATPTYARSAYPASLAWVHGVPVGFAPHYVAVQPGRCRRFIGDTHTAGVCISRMMEQSAVRLRRHFGPHRTQSDS
jgi:hypothetical protein